MAAICPHCKGYVEKGWILDFKRDNVEVFKLGGHRCPEQRPTRMLKEKN